MPHAAKAHERLRTGDPAILARIERDRLVFDLRTVAQNEEGPLLEALRTL